MTITQKVLDKLRRSVAETGDAPFYTDGMLAEYLLEYPLMDDKGRSPDDPEWSPTYDLNAAAGDIWAEKASTFAGSFDFAADGGNYHRSQVYQQMIANARQFRSRRSAKTVRAHYSPKRKDV